MALNLKEISKEQLEYLGMKYYEAIIGQKDVREDILTDLYGKYAHGVSKISLNLHFG